MWRTIAGPEGLVTTRARLMPALEALLAGWQATVLPSRTILSRETPACRSGIEVPRLR